MFSENLYIQKEFYATYLLLRIDSPTGRKKKLKYKI